MKAPERASASRSKGEIQPHEPAELEWDGRVAAVSDELEDVTDRAVGRTEDGLSSRQEPIAPTAAPYVPRERRRTVASTITAELAKSMGEVRDPAASAEPPKPTRRAGEARDQAVPAVMSPEVTRRVDESGPAEPEEVTQETRVGDVIDEIDLPPKELVEALIERARSCMEGGNLGTAVIAADQALAEAGRAADEEVTALVKVARPLLDRIFAAYVRLLEQVPVRALSDDEIAGRQIGDRTRHLLASVNAALTLEQISRSTRIPPVEALAIAASLLGAGIIRIK